MQGPTKYVEHLTENQYHPRSDAHSNALCRGVLADLLDQCEVLAEKARAGRVVATLNHTVTVRYQRWNIDLAIGPPPGDPEPPVEGSPIRFATPTTVELAFEAKGVMTEHGKARRNRLRDLQAFHSHAHNYDDAVVAGGIVVVNVADVYWSPTRDEDDVTLHRNIETLAPDTVDLYRNIPLRYQPSEGPGMEGVSVLVVDHDNLRKNENLPDDAPAPGVTTLVTDEPAPQTGDPLNYSTMIYRLCRAYRDRWK
jgi:hypothetical protein